MDPGSCFQRPRILDLGSCFQRTKGFGALAHVFRGPKVPDPGSCFQRPRILDLGSCFQRTKGFFFGFDSRQCVWAFYPSTCKINIFN